MIQDHNILYFAVVDNNDGYFNGSADFRTARAELLERRALVSEEEGDPTNVVMVAVLDV